MALDSKSTLIILFIFGVIGILFGVIFILGQLYSQGYILNPSASTPYTAIAGWAAVGAVLLFFGSILIYFSYPAIIPLKEKTSASTIACQHCGEVLPQDSTVCEKCKKTTRR